MSAQWIGGCAVSERITFGIFAVERQRVSRGTIAGAQLTELMLSRAPRSLVSMTD